MWLFRESGFEVRKEQLGRYLFPPLHRNKICTHPISSPEGTMSPIPACTQAEARSRPLTSIYYREKGCMELCLHSSRPLEASFLFKHAYNFSFLVLCFLKITYILCFTSWGWTSLIWELKEYFTDWIVFKFFLNKFLNFTLFWDKYVVTTFS